MAIRVGGAVVVTAAAVLAAVVESFLVPFRIGTAAVPLAGALAFILNWALAALAMWWVRARWAVVLTVLAWFAVVLTASMPTDGGSLVIVSSMNGYALLLAGTAGVAVSLWRYFRPVRATSYTPVQPAKETRP